MYSLINLLNVAALRYRLSAVYDVLLAMPEPVTKNEIHEDFLSAWVGLGGERDGAQCAWVRVLTLENPAAAELALFARVLGVNTTWLLTGDPRFINHDYFTDHCLCWETPRSQQFVYYGATEPGSAAEYNPECLVHANPEITASPLAHHGTVTLSQPRTTIEDWSGIAGATRHHFSPVEIRQTQARIRRPSVVQAF